MTAPRGSDAFVIFDHVQKSYDGETLVVKDLNLEIGKRRVPDAARAVRLGQDHQPDDARRLRDRRLTARSCSAAGRSNNIPPHKRGIGMVFQNYALFPHMTVAENLAFPLAVRGARPAPSVERKVARALDMVRMGGFGGRRPAQLSGGQQQRVALARALVFEPDLVLMDEPLGALDKQLREHMQFEIKHLHERLGVTVVYVTHDQAEALTMSDRIAVFNDGRDPAARRARGLYERPENSFVAQFHRREQHARTASSRLWTVRHAPSASATAR